MQEVWNEILDASGLTDHACEAHGNDLLDGIADPSEDLGHVFRVLCRHEGVTTWDGVEPILARIRSVDGFEHLRIPDNRISQIMDHAGDVGPADARGAHLTSLRRGTYSSDHGTPEWIISAVRGALGHIDLDLASSERHNRIVGADRFYSEDRPCPPEPDVAISGRAAVVWCNPPGPGWLVHEFWETWLGCVRRGACGAFLFFNTDTMRKAAPPPMDLEVVLLSKRVRFVGAKGGASFPSALVFAGAPAPRDLGHVLVWGWTL